MFTKTCIYHHTKVVTLLSTICLFSCSAGYQSGRVYAPKVNQAGQVELEVSTSQSQLSYALSDQFALSLSGVYRVDHSLPYLGKLRSELVSGALGTHYSSPLSSNMRFSVGFEGTLEYWWVGGYQRWSRPFSMNSALSRGVTETIEESSLIVSPSAQVAVIFDQFLTKNATFMLFSKLSTPLFLDEEMSDVMGRPLMAQIGVEYRRPIVHPFGIYAQVLGRNFIDGGPTGDLFDSESEFSILPLDAFFGFTFLFDPPKP